MTPVVIETERLILRQWRDSDLPVFAEMNADPEVMEYFPTLLSQNQSDAMAQKCRQLIDDKGWGFWALSEKGKDNFVGFAGLHVPTAALPFAPCVEIGWRLHKDYWGLGYATEAAEAALEFGFNTLDLEDVVSFTTLGNGRSRAVMERLGMRTRLPNFRHPDIPRGHCLSQHVLYHINRSQWLEHIGESAIAS